MCRKPGSCLLSFPWYFTLKIQGSVWSCSPEGWNCQRMGTNLDGHKWRWPWGEKGQHHQFLLASSTGCRLAFLGEKRAGQVKFWSCPAATRVKTEYSSKFFPLHLQQVVLSHPRDVATLGQHNSQSVRVWFCKSSSNQSFLTQWILWPHWARWRASRQFSRPQSLTCQKQGKANAPLKGIAT